MSRTTGRTISQAREQLIETLLAFCGLISVLTTLGIVVVLLLETLGFFQQVSLWAFFTDTQLTPLFTEKHFGILPLLAGTLLVCLTAMAMALPMGLLTALYLSEYSPEKVRRRLKPILEILAGVPTVVYGYFALLFVTPLLQGFLPGLAGFNALSPGIVMGIMFYRWSLP